LTAAALCLVACEDPQPQSRLSPADQAQLLLQAKVRFGPIKPSEQADLERAIARRYPAGSKVPEHTAFYFDGKPTSCGTVQPRGRRTQRYIYRDGAVITEDDASPSNFDMFWQICTAGGAPR